MKKEKQLHTDYFPKKKSESTQQVQQEFTCHECGKVCANQGNLVNHMKAKHPVTEVAGSILKYAHTKKPTPLWKVLCVVGAFWMGSLLKPGKMDPERTTFSRVVRNERGSETWMEERTIVAQIVDNDTQMNSKPRFWMNGLKKKLRTPIFLKTHLPACTESHNPI